MTGLESLKTESTLYSKPESLADRATHYCAGCGHGIVQRLIAEVVDELNIFDRAICVSSIGCTVTSYNYFNFDGLESAHGRAPAVATAIKRCHPNLVPFTIQGDGDLASIGVAEIVHVCARGENLTIIFVNNAIYGMTGGQMAPTTLIDMYSTSTPGGRKPDTSGYPIRMSEMLSTLDGPAYISRVSLHNPANIRRAKKAIKLAFKTQLAGLGLSLVEILSPCPVNWKMDPVKALEFVAGKMTQQYPLGEFKISDAAALLKKDL
ncbi:MAG TPA: 2-oxoglutarate oxidoreductase [Dehalococcoidia bacterium]|nr:2-oxoglutarate oxidoreductase [Dehalococcoidia bacterium]